MEEGALVLKMRNFVPEDGALILEEILVSEREGFFLEGGGSYLERRGSCPRRREALVLEKEDLSWKKGALVSEEEGFFL